MMDLVGGRYEIDGVLSSFANIRKYNRLAW
jgi:hypothetical protein